MFDIRGRSRGFPRRSLHMQSVGLGIPKISLRQSLNLARSPELKMFLMLVKSPSHVLFIASNVAVLVHLKFFSTMKKNDKLEHLKLQAAELENYESVVSDLDKKLESVQNQIKIIKSQKESGIRKPLSNDKKQSAKWSKYRENQLNMLRDQQNLAKRFVASRELIATKLSEPENIARLFEADDGRSTGNISEEIIEDYETDPLLRTYSSPILNIMMLLSNLIITSCLVDLNLRFSLRDKYLKNINSSSKELFRPNLFECMKPDQDKKEMFQELAKLRQGPAVDLKQGLRNLDAEKRQALFQEFQENDAFSSRELRRYDMYLYKSGRWRNYENSDTSRWIHGIQGPVFRTNTVDSTEYLKRFQNLYSTYRKNRSPFKHFNFVLKIAKELARGGNCIPSNAIFRDLLDKFGQARLYNYQALVYEHLPSFRDRKTAWADGIAPHAFAETNLLHFQDLIEEDPRLLSSLLKYHERRENASSIKSLLEILDPIQTRPASSQSVLPSFMTKLSRSQLTVSNETARKNMIFDIRIINDAIVACVSVKDFKSIDKLLSKLVFNLIDTPKGVKIVCGDKFASHDLVLNNTAAEEIVGKLFYEKLLCTLGNAYVQDNDTLRCKWVASLIQNYIKERGSEKLESLYSHLLDILEPGQMPEVRPNHQVESPQRFEYESSSWLTEPVLAKDETTHRLSVITA
ncbi:hypothetical protein METBIDRAFT_216639 [Metschnikowia bicuspidata var. bicuspidata NRRL YB-4993]|uniref:Uncharacterized protein n=1 Tax=Metschnikowia bicuspidata var. bicuspidata NRRL YB-4993 TaxID=869754 RepID=A0A1A0H6L7_9ASCO|nr:hypothetical protein METBIDRAFT_216639 [Metschnikowia bicuspidata var. bicuspidata NRRL YB-4993]OBA19552.1 hypothetical protein METBIDRAFT_216639 [Metschnikowia bicuspidata var. bicuspidata NRRL YB-4993]